MPGPREGAELFNHSILIAAHPDDEVLFFSSIMDKVDEVVFCFLEHGATVHLAAGREESLREHPLKNISCLGLKESRIFWKVDWQNPIITEYGMKEPDRTVPDKQYRDNYYALKTCLRKRLDGYSNVVTHNPWGEYGHAEHVQIYRVVRQLQEEMGFALWFSNYCSNKSFPLMLRYVSGYNSDYITLPTNKEASRHIKSIYERNNCWTWFGDWEWFNDESFMKDSYGTELSSIGAIESAPCGHIFPLNMLNLRTNNAPSPSRSNLLRVLTSKVMQRFSSLSRRTFGLSTTFMFRNLP
ncbi:MAG: PIG-L family deacetylase [Thermodesulfovibrionales bacterium]